MPRVTSSKSRSQLAETVQRLLCLPTKKEAENVINTVLIGIEETLLDNLEQDNFSLKLNNLGKLTVRHTPARSQKVGFSGEQVQVPAKRNIRFTSLGRLRQSAKKAT